MQTTNSYTKYVYNGTNYDSLYDLHKAVMSNVSFPDSITDVQLSVLGITKTTVTETINYNCYCVIGSSSPIYVPTTVPTTWGTNEVLMSADQTISNSVAKEDGTWVTPTSEYTVYTCTDGKLAVDLETTKQNKIAPIKQLLSSVDYRTHEYLEGYITEEQYTLIKNIKVEWRTAINTIKSASTIDAVNAVIINTTIPNLH